MDFMRKVILVLASVFALGAANAQSGKNQFGIGAELGLGTASGSKLSYGGSLKYLHGIGDAGQVTLTAGYIMSSSTEDFFGVEVKSTSSMIPILAGYRHNFSGFYVEPQVGYIMNRINSKVDGETIDGYPVSEGAFGYAIGGGYAMESGLDLGVSFRNTAKAGSTGLIVFRIGYNFSLGGN
jgi:hypothetical protein